MVVINTEVEALYADNFIGVGAYLNIFSSVNHNGFCLAYKFTHRDFDDGVLGLAYVANTRFGAGGICDTFTGTRGLNTGIFANNIIIILHSVSMVQFNKYTVYSRTPEKKTYYKVP